MKISASVSPAEHWLTLMNCAHCKRTPDRSPVYKCNYGHVMCFNCFQNLAHDEAIPMCPECDSEQFTRQDVSDDFLRKLKTKPGIGRPYRYQLKPDKPQRDVPVRDLITLEEIFQLPSEKLHQIFEDCTKEKLTYLSQLSATECLPGKLAQLSRVAAGNASGSAAPVPDKLLLDAMPSRKPLRCPHDNCRKIIAISSFKAHFKYEHFDFKRYYVVRGSELCVPLDPAQFQHGKSVCMGIISLGSCEDDGVSLPTISSTSMTMGHLNQPGCEGDALDLFWLMATGSLNDTPCDAHIMLWMFTNNEDVEYNCTMELTSQDNIITMTTFCRVNRLFESQSVADVARRGCCLYLSYCTVRSMLQYGPSLNFRLTIH